jgi:hypothetical protein
MNAKTACAFVMGAAFLLLVLATLAHSAGPWPAAIPPATAAGSALWKGRTFEAVLQGFIILAGVLSILLLLGSQKFREGLP